jgi:hypothetical protein
MNAESATPTHMPEARRLECHEATCCDIAFKAAPVYFRLRRACIEHDTAQQRTKRTMVSLKRTQRGLVAKHDAGEHKQTHKCSDLRIRMVQGRSALARKRQSSNNTAIAIEGQAERVCNAQNRYRRATSEPTPARVATTLLPNNRF